MKLYATTTSERASKGQGGNNYLHIDLFIETNKGNEKVGEVNIAIYRNEAVISYQNITNDIGIGISKELKRVKLRGKKQKSEELLSNINKIAEKIFFIDVKHSKE